MRTGVRLCPPPVCDTPSAGRRLARSFRLAMDCKGTGPPQCWGGSSNRAVDHTDVHRPIEKSAGECVSAAGRSHGRSFAAEHDAENHPPWAHHTPARVSADPAEYAGVALRVRKQAGDLR